MKTILKTSFKNLLIRKLEKINLINNFRNIKSKFQ